MVEGVTVEDLDKESFDIFRREAVRSKRMTKDDLNVSNVELLDSLDLLKDGKLTRAAVLLFHRTPQKWMFGTYTKIGRFGKGSDLLYQDEVIGSLFLQAERVIELIYLKYLKEKPTATQKELQEALNETRTHIQAIIKELVYLKAMALSKVELVR